jgi:sigma-B regulation protein RsbU (phosphoserine phosphatase)
LILLIIDDDVSMQSMLQGWLSNSGHAVRCVSSFDCDAEFLTSSAAEVILCNWHLQGKPAAEICKTVRSDEVFRYIIAYADEHRTLDFEECASAGADDILLSPMRQTQLEVRLLMAQRMLHLQQAFAEQNAAHIALNEKLDVAYQALYAELQAASELQLSLLPTVTDIHPKYSLDWLVLPSSFLAGDNLNYFIVQERYLIFYHLDVAGHGIPSALLSVTLNQLLSPQPGSPMVRFDPQLELKRVVPPVEVISELNRRFQPQGDGYFTMIYAVLDTETREIRFCQAGHPSPLKVTRDGTVTEVGDGGFPVGLWPDMTYDETVTTLEAGDRLVLYSDGILACLNAAGEAYSIEQLEDVVRRHGEVPLKEVLQAVKTDLEDWTHGSDFPDDISLLILESK